VRACRIDRLQQRPLDQEAFAVQIPPRLVLIDRAAGFPYPQLENLPRIVPLVDRVRDVEPFIALEPDQIGVERRGDGGRQRGLADAGFTFEEERAMQAQRQEDGNGEAVVGDVVLRGQTLLQVLDGAAEDADLPRGSIARGRRLLRVRAPFALTRRRALGRRVLPDSPSMSSSGRQAISV